MSKELVLSCMKADPITGAHIASLTGLEVDVIAKTCYALHKEGAIKRVKVPNTGTKKQGSAPTVYAYFVDDARAMGEVDAPVQSAEPADQAPDQVTTKHQVHLAELIEKAARLQADNAQLRTDYHVDIKALQARIDGLMLANRELQNRIADLEATEPLPYRPLPIPSGKPVYAGYTTIALCDSGLYATEEDARRSAIRTLQEDDGMSYQVAVCGILAVAENTVTQVWKTGPEQIQFEQ